MENNTEKKNEQGGDIYSDFTGYFPKEYDLTPEKLEEAIETENKMSAIALGMTAPSKSHIREETPQPESKNEITVETVNPDTDNEVLDGTTREFKRIKPKEEEPDDSWTPPQADDVTDNALLNKYEPLDNLLSELEDNSEYVDSDSIPAKESTARKTLNWFFDLLEVLTICMVSIIIIFSFVARLTKVDGESMESTLQDGQYLVVSDMFYTPTPGDIVVLQDMDAADARLRDPLVKRVIAIGGQTVDIAENGTVTIIEEDGESHVLDEDYIKDEPYMRRPCHVTVPKGYVFVMGDNRNNSSDSREPSLGVIDERCIFGKAVIRLLPFSDFTVFKNPHKS